MFIMQRRVIAVFLLFCLSCGMICVRIYTFMASDIAASHTMNHNKKIVIDTLRFPFYDCNSEPLVNNEFKFFAAFKPDSEVADKLCGFTDRKELEKIMTAIKNRTPSYCAVDKPVQNDEYIVCLKKYVRYSDSQPAVHLLGYINGDGAGVSGLEKAFDSFLVSDTQLYASFPCDASGRVIHGAEIITDSEYLTSKGGVYLTVDKRIQQIVQEELNASTIKKGAVLVCGTKTGEIKAMASVPVFDPYNISDYLDDTSSPLVNRAVSSYPVGSVFKVSVAAAALESGVGENFTFDCDGQIEVDGTVYRCNNSTAHGKVDMRSALIHSCNGYFIALAQKIGSRTVLEMAKRLGFGEKIYYAENIASSSGKLPDLNSLSVSGNLANFAFGQGEFTANTLQIANMFSCIGNGGEYFNPHVVSHVVDKNGKTVYTFKQSAPVKAVDRRCTESIKDMLIDVINDGTAKNAKTEGFVCAGKTATAQTGIFNPDKTEKLCTWFGGFFPAEEPEYTVVIIKEDGTTGGADCAPVFKSIAQRLFEIQKR